MNLIVLVEASDGANPGHMVIGQGITPNTARFFGFRFDPDALPLEYRTPDRWQEYLFSNKTLGSIEDDSIYVQELLSRKKAQVYEKQAVCDVSIEAHIPPHAQWQHFADYSFSPDDFHSDASPCYNCVTWATMIANALAPGFLTPVRQGRIKLMIQQLRADAEKSGESHD